jgi:hypothetical protein
VTHEYVIALNGRIEPQPPGSDRATAVGWAAEAVLAVGPDDAVRAISRGDSSFLDLDGCVVTPLPTDPTRADTLVAEATGAADSRVDVAGLLIGAGLLGPGAMLEPGAPADLAFWDAVPWPGDAGHEFALGLVAVVREGAFTEGDEHYGPFPPPTPSTNDLDAAGGPER